MASDRCLIVSNVTDRDRNQSPFRAWFWPALWAAVFPADGLAQAMTAVKLGMVKLNAITTGAVRELLVTYIKGFVGSVGAGAYTRSTDKLVFACLTEAGTMTNLEVMCAPKDAILEEDGSTLKISDPLVQAIIGPLIDGSNFCDAAGNTYVGVLRGWRASENAKGKRPGGR